MWEFFALSKKLKGKTSVYVHICSWRKRFKTSDGKVLTQNLTHLCSKWFTTMTSSKRSPYEAAGSTGRVQPKTCASACRVYCRIISVSAAANRTWTLLEPASPRIHLESLSQRFQLNSRCCLFAFWQKSWKSGREKNKSVCEVQV